MKHYKELLIIMLLLLWLACSKQVRYYDSSKENCDSTVYDCVDLGAKKAKVQGKDVKWYMPGIDDEPCDTAKYHCIDMIRDR